MGTSFVLPLYPLEDTILLPGEDLAQEKGTGWVRNVVRQAHDFGGAVVASLVDGESVHEVGVTALVADESEESVTLHGVTRCRLLTLVHENADLVRAERFPEPPPVPGRARGLAQLLAARYARLCRNLSRPVTLPTDPAALSALTWRVTASLGLTPQQQQGFLNVPDPLTRGRLLLVAVREIERRERFLRPWAHLRVGTPWN